MLQWLWRQLRAIQALSDRLRAEIASFLLACLHLLVEMFTHYDEIASDIRDIAALAVTIRANVEREIQQLQQFAFNPQWKNRVINVPIAIDQTRSFIRTVFLDTSDRIHRLTEPFHALSLILKQEAAPDPQDPTAAVNGFTKASVKLGHVAVAIHELRDAFEAVSEFVDVFRQLREEIEGLDSFFLQQGNQRRNVTVHIRQRVARGARVRNVANGKKQTVPTNVESSPRKAAFAGR